MRDQELEVIQKRAFRPKTTQSCHDQPIAPNRLKSLPEPPKRPNEVWCADITYIPCQQDGWLYLAGELDLCSRRLVGWKLGASWPLHLSWTLLNGPSKIGRIFQCFIIPIEAFNTPQATSANSWIAMRLSP